MTKKTHAQGGFLIALITSPIVISLLEVNNKAYVLFLIIVYIYGSYFGSLLPDIDLKSSYISKKLPIIYKLFGSHLKHRGFTHSIIFLFILWLCVVSLVILSDGDYIVRLFFNGLLVGCISHVVLDLLTSDGVYLFSPIKKIVRLSNIKTNSKKEKNINKLLKILNLLALVINGYAILMI